MATKAIKKTAAYVAYDQNGTRHVFGTQAERDAFNLYTKKHTEAQRHEDELNGSLAALVCNTAWRMNREL